MVVLTQTHFAQLASLEPLFCFVNHAEFGKCCPWTAAENYDEIIST